MRSSTPRTLIGCLVAHSARMTSASSGPRIFSSSSPDTRTVYYGSVVDSDQSRRAALDVAAAHGQPRAPRDAQDDGGDREADQRVGDRRSKPYDQRARDDREAYVRVGAGVVAVSDQGRTFEASARARADHRRHLIADVAEEA